MADRIVVSFHLRGANADARRAATPISRHAEGSPGSTIGRIVALKKRADTLGAILSAWGPSSLVFDLPADDIESAVDLALSAFEDESEHNDRFVAAIAFGPIERLEEPSGGGAPMPAWGRPIASAWELAQRAEAGEVLIDEEGTDHFAQVVRVTDHRSFEGDALFALVLDTRHPFRRDTVIDSEEQGNERVRVAVPKLPPISGLSRELLDRKSGPISSKAIASERRVSEPPPTVRTEIDQSLLAAEALRAAIEVRVAIPKAPPSIPPTAEPTTDESEPIAVPARGLPSSGTAPSVPPPPPTMNVSVPAPPSAPPLSGGRISWPGSDEYNELTAAARQALLKGNVTELERLADELRSRGEADLAARMAAFVAWNRGSKAEGLRKLRTAADAETRPAHRVRALLAYGVALAASGRTDAALLAALGALGRAREVADRQGEHVCARFLARLSAAAGYQRAAQTWATVADGVVGARSA